MYVNVCACMCVCLFVSMCVSVSSLHDGVYRSECTCDLNLCFVLLQIRTALVNKSSFILVVETLEPFDKIEVCISML